MPEYGIVEVMEPSVGPAEAPRHRQSTQHEQGRLERGLETQRPSNKFSKYYTVALFCLTTALLFADQNLLAPNVRSLKLKVRHSLRTVY